MVKRAPFPPIQGSGRMHANNGVSRRNIPFDASSFYRSASFFLWECFLNNFFIWSLAGGPSIHGETQRIETQLEVRELLAHRAFAASCPTAMSFLALARRGRTCRVATICRPERTREEDPERILGVGARDSGVRFQPDKLTSRSIESQFVSTTRRDFFERNNASTESPACRPTQYGPVQTGARMPEATQDLPLAMCCARGVRARVTMPPRRARTRDS